MSDSTFQVKLFSGSKFWVEIWRMKKKTNGGGGRRMPHDGEDEEW